MAMVVCVMAWESVSSVRYTHGRSVWCVSVGSSSSPEHRVDLMTRTVVAKEESPANRVATIYDYDAGTAVSAVAQTLAMGMTLALTLAAWWNSSDAESAIRYLNIAIRTSGHTPGSVR